MRNKKIRDTLTKIIFYVLLILAIVAVLIPPAWIISTSIKPAREIFAKPPRWIPQAPTLESYRSVLFESAIPQAFFNSMVIGLMTTFLAIILGGLSGYGFARFKFRGSKMLSLFMLMSQMLPITVFMIPMFYMENNLGLVDTKIGLAIAHLVISLPLVTWMAKGYFAGIPKEIEEAAFIDGCTTFQVMMKVILPLVKPAIAATGIYAFISSWNEFALANVLTRTMVSRTVPIQLNEFSSFFKVDWGDTMAASAIITIPVVIAFMSIQKQFVAGLAAGSVKG